MNMDHSTTQFLSHTHVTLHEFIGSPTDGEEKVDIYCNISYHVTRHDTYGNLYLNRNALGRLIKRVIKAIGSISYTPEQLHEPENPKKQQKLPLNLRICI